MRIKIKQLEGGQIRYCIYQWENITSDREILDIVEKKDGNHRMILNFKPLNKNVLYLHFKMDTLTSILKLVNQNSRMASVDLKQEYYSCPVSKSHQKYLKFIWNGYVYKFACFPQWFSVLFTKIHKVAEACVCHTSKNGLHSGWLH